SAATHTRLTHAFAQSDALFEGRWAWELAQHLPEDTPIHVASSMPVRDFEFFWPTRARRVHPFANRGANGIDGTLSTALGIATAAARPTVLITGDLALLHDSNGALIAPHFKGSLTILLLDNAGGGIFHNLPIAQFDPIFEHYFTTPQSLDWQAWATAHHIPFETLNDWSTFRQRFAHLPDQGIRLLRLPTDRHRDTLTRQQLLTSNDRGLLKTPQL
ncbi:MAG: 2-succinyl-5-enolpyruvyl-6-hydroxy-3-cyclohexene-1-carboxylic-acid synthase, partial [Verrucomicrobiota bacterium]